MVVVHFFLFLFVDLFVGRIADAQAREERDRAVEQCVKVAVVEVFVVLVQVVVAMVVEIVDVVRVGYGACCGCRVVVVVFVDRWLLLLFEESGDGCGDPAALGQPVPAQRARTDRAPLWHRQITTGVIARTLGHVVVVAVAVAALAVSSPSPLLGRAHNGGRRDTTNATAEQRAHVGRDAERSLHR